MKRRLPNEFGQLRCSNCEKWFMPDKFRDCETACGKASWCKICAALASTTCKRESRLKARMNRIIVGEYFIPTANSNGDIILDEDGFPFKCTQTRNRIIYATDGEIEQANGKMKPCVRLFSPYKFTFERTKKGRMQIN